MMDICRKRSDTYFCLNQCFDYPTAEMVEPGTAKTIGDKIGPNLGTSDSLTSPVNLITAMWNHAPAMEQLVRERGLAWPKFEGNEMRDLVEFLKSPKETATRRTTR